MKAGWLFAPVLALALSSPALAEPQRYEIDSVHSRVLLRVWHAGYSQAMATLSAPRGTLWYDAEQVENSRVRVELPLDRLDFGDADWNARMARPDYFDSANHPLAVFESERVEDLGEGRLRVHGQLKLRGTSAQVSLEARINRSGARLPYVPRDSIGASATALLDRRAFGMRKHAGAVGDAVEVWIELEARRARAGRSSERGDARNQRSKE
jgi:polyisoprenoid-binding protein YceI